MPLSAPIRGKDGSLISEVPLPRDTDIAIALWGSNINPAVWGEDAEQWKPERFLQPLPEAVTDARIPGVYSNLLVSTITFLVLFSLPIFPLQDDLPWWWSGMHVGRIPLIPPSQQLI